MAGLSQCSSIGFGNAYCGIKLTEVILSALIATFAFVEIVVSMVRIHGKFVINFIIAIEIFFFLSMGCKCFYEIWHNIIQYFAIFFYDMAFITIFYFVAFNTIRGRLGRIFVHSLYFFFTALLTILTILRIQDKIQDPKPLHCTQKWYIIVDGLTMTISIVLFAVFCLQHWKQRKIQQYQQTRRTLKPVVSQSYKRDNLELITKDEGKHLADIKNSKSWKAKNKNPFTRMWILILTNIICSILNFLQAVILLVYFSQNCQFSENRNVRALANFGFEFPDYYLGSFITLFIFRLMRVSYMDSLRLDVLFSQNTSIKDRSDSFAPDSSLAMNKLELILDQSLISEDRSQSVDSKIQNAFQ